MVPRNLYPTIGAVFAPSAKKMQETLNKNARLKRLFIRKAHFLQFFVADSVLICVNISKATRTLTFTCTNDE